MYTLLLAFRYATYHRGKTTIITIAVACAMFMPLALNVMVAEGQTQLMRRADLTPLVLGAPGSRVDLVLHALHFTAQPASTVSYDAARTIGRWHAGATIPLYTAFTARGVPIVGTSLEYFRFRQLRVAAGTLPQILGDCVLGAGAAAKLDLEPGDALISDPENVFNIAGAYPLKMHVVGILDAASTDDDNAVFVDVKTAWVIAGLGHGHDDVSAATEDVVLERRSGSVVASAALPHYTEITPENIDSFHFHGDMASYPLTALIVVPESQRAETLLEARLAEHRGRWQAVRPRDVVFELISTIAKVKRLFDANLGLAATTTALLLGLVVLLSIRIRAHEMDTMMKLGCSRGTTARLQIAELLGVFALSAALAGAAAWAALRLAPALLPWLMT